MPLADSDIPFEAAARRADNAARQHTEPLKQRIERLERTAAVPPQLSRDEAAALDRWMNVLTRATGAVEPHDVSEARAKFRDAWRL